jgi:hypothetical protein
MGYDDWSECVEALRNARIFGSEYDFAIPVTDEDSIVAKLHSQLVLAHEADPLGGWDAYYSALPEGAVDHEAYIHWDQVVLVGFSQGASNNTMLATHVAVRGVLQISGPGDDVVEWTLDPGATPGCARIGIRHDAEGLASVMDDTYDAMGLPGPPATIEDFELGACDTLPWPPYGGSQQLQTNLQPAASCTSSDNSHGSMGNDECMNLVDAPDGDPYALFRAYLGALCMLGENTGCE